MKYILFSIAAVLVISMGSCDKESAGTEFDLSDTLQPYLIIGTDPIETTPDSTATITFTMRTGLSKDVTVTYNVTGSLALGTKTVVFPKYTTTMDLVIDVPVGTPSPSTTTVTLVSAEKSDGTPLTIGRYADPTDEKVDISIITPP